MIPLMGFDREDGKVGTTLPIFFFEMPLLVEDGATSRSGGGRSSTAVGGCGAWRPATYCRNGFGI